jgi:hypothetical protein
VNGKTSGEGYGNMEEKDTFEIFLECTVGLSMQNTKSTSDKRNTCYEL